MKHINTLCVQNEELLNVKVGGTYSHHWSLKSKPILSVLRAGITAQNHKTFRSLVTVYTRPTSGIALCPLDSPEEVP
jgi:hypothetical protein